MRVSDLTGRHFTIAMDLIDGMTARHIAAREHISEQAARRLVQEVYDKAGVEGRRELRAKAEQEWATNL